MARAFPVVVLLLLVAAATYASLTQGFSAGLPASDGAQKRGCTCHCASADTSLTVALDGIPAEWEATKAYDLTVSFTGGATVDLPTASNEGGFALEVTHGTLATKDDKTQVSDVGGAKRFATHTTAGNDQASWPVRWTAPAAGAGDVTFYLATNNVNGDQQNGSGACTDNWNKIESRIREKAAPPPPEKPPEPEEPVEPVEGDPVFEDDFEGNGTANDTGDESGGKGKGLLPGFELPVSAAAAALAALALRLRSRRD